MTSLDKLANTETKMESCLKGKYRHSYHLEGFKQPKDGFQLTSQFMCQKGN